MRALITDANNFEKALEQVPIPGKKGKIINTDIYKGLDDANNVTGYAFVAVGSGFADKIKIVIAVDDKCEKFLGFKVLSSNETPGFGSKIIEDNFGNQFKNVLAGKINLSKVGDPQVIDSRIVAITGATVSSQAVVNIFNTYIEEIKEQLQTKEFIKNDS